ncbi:MAG: nucleoside 2-deoxyribosyltransferase [Candidatus Methanoperedens sp.]|nr:nucleoside 2-deoxyribosyltransferase [Candidatus Methanoperedens sp.]
MKIFFAGSIRGGRQLIPTYRHIIGFLKSQGYVIISEHVAAQGLEETEAKLLEQEIFEKDTRWIKESDRVVAEVTVPSTGVGYEVCYAVAHKKPVLCVYEEGAKVSAMVLGNTSRYVTVRSYSDEKQLEKILLDFPGK